MYAVMCHLLTSADLSLTLRCKPVMLCEQSTAYNAMHGQSGEQSDQCRRLDQVLKRYQRKEVQVVDWLDTLALQKIELLRQEVSCSSSYF